jgi:hypothetical protein
VKSWGAHGTGPGQFNTPHAIVVDRNNQIYVGDRGNRRIQVFDADGKFLRLFTIDVPPAPGTKAVNGNTPTDERLAQTIGAPNSICITPGPNQVLFVGESTFPGRVFKVTLEGKVVTCVLRPAEWLDTKLRKNLRSRSHSADAPQLACTADQCGELIET